MLKDQGESNPNKNGPSRTHTLVHTHTVRPNEKEGAPGRQCTFGTNCKNPPKITLEKFVKLSGHTCVCNNLTSFECEVHKNRKQKWCKSAENCFGKLVKSHKGGFQLLDLMLTELKSHMTCKRSRSLIGGNFICQKKSCLNAVISTNERHWIITCQVTVKLRYNQI